MGALSAYRVSKPRSRVRGYWIRAELRRLRRQARSSGVPLQVLISRNLNLTESPEEAVPLALAEVLPADQADDRMVEQISKRVTSHIVQRLKSERATATREQVELNKDEGMLLNELLKSRGFGETEFSPEILQSEAFKRLARRIELDLGH